MKNRVVLYNLFYLYAKFQFFEYSSCLTFLVKNILQKIEIFKMNFRIKLITHINLIKYYNFSNIYFIKIL